MTDGTLRNDDKQPVRLTAIPSIPCFEVWLLLHFEDVRAPLHRDEVMTRLKQHLPDYAKGAQGVFACTRDRLDRATQRAQALAARFNAHTDPEPFTALHTLVTHLITLRA